MVFIIIAANRVSCFQFFYWAWAFILERFSKVSKKSFAWLENVLILLPWIQYFIHLQISSHYLLVMCLLLYEGNNNLFNLKYSQWWYMCMLQKIIDRRTRICMYSLKFLVKVVVPPIKCYFYKLQFNAILCIIFGKLITLRHNLKKIKNQKI